MKPPAFDFSVMTLFCKQKVKEHIFHILVFWLFLVDTKSLGRGRQMEEMCCSSHTFQEQIKVQLRNAIEARKWAKCYVLKSSSLAWGGPSFLALWQNEDGWWMLWGFFFRYLLFCNFVCDLLLFQYIDMLIFVHYFTYMTQIEINGASQCMKCHVIFKNKTFRTGFVFLRR